MPYPASGDALVPIAVAPNTIVAQIWQELLADEGIPVLLRMTSPLFGYISQDSPCEVSVRAEHEAQAREILAAFHADAQDFVLEDEDVDEFVGDEDRSSEQ